MGCGSLVLWKHSCFLKPVLVFILLSVTMISKDEGSVNPHKK